MKVVVKKQVEPNIKCKIYTDANTTEENNY